MISLLDLSVIPPENIVSRKRLDISLIERVGQNFSEPGLFYYI